MDYNGLPGLIMQIEIGTNAIVKFEKLIIKNDLENSIEEPKNKSKMLTIAEYESKKTVNLKLNILLFIC
jgi:GLPGLI family protein